MSSFFRHVQGRNRRDGRRLSDGTSTRHPSAPSQSAVNQRHSSSAGNSSTLSRTLAHVPFTPAAAAAAAGAEAARAEEEFKWAAVLSFFGGRNMVHATLVDSTDEGVRVRTSPMPGWLKLPEFHQITYETYVVVVALPSKEVEPADHELIKHMPTGTNLWLCETKLPSRSIVRLLFSSDVSAAVSFQRDGNIPSWYRARGMLAVATIPYSWRQLKVEVAKSMTMRNWKPAGPILKVDQESQVVEVMLHYRSRDERDYYVVVAISFHYLDEKTIEQAKSGRGYLSMTGRLETGPCARPTSGWKWTQSSHKEFIYPCGSARYPLERVNNASGTLQSCGHR